MLDVRCSNQTESQSSSFYVHDHGMGGIGALCITPLISHIHARQSTCATWGSCTASVTCTGWQEQPAALTLQAVSCGHAESTQIQALSKGWVILPSAAQVEQLSKLMRQNTRAVVVNFPHNPTGALPSKADWAEMTQLCKSSRAYLFSDEMYR